MTEVINRFQGPEGSVETTAPYIYPIGEDDFGVWECAGLVAEPHT